MRGAWLIAVVCLVLAPCPADGQSKTDPTLDKLAVAFAAAYNAHDAAKVASFYADDGVLMVPAQPMIRGRSNIEKHYESTFGQQAGRLRLTPLESAITGAHAFEMGAAVATLGPLSDNGKYVIIYKRVRNEWKIAFDIFNSDQSAPTRAPETQARVVLPGL
jgi:uncharacterized protein (TIGR02246 family)